MAPIDGGQRSSSDPAMASNGLTKATNTLEAVSGGLVAACGGPTVVMVVQGFGFGSNLFFSFLKMFPSHKNLTFSWGIKWK